MKGIEKGVEPPAFTHWKNHTNEDWRPTFNKLQAPEKEDLRIALLEEQGYICAYCSGRIENDPLKTVVEHFVPQHGEQGDMEKSLDYKNLHACCRGKIQTFSHCDSSKKDKFRDSLHPSIELIGPTSRNDAGFICEQAFAYTIVGNVIPTIGSSFEASARYSINLLNLNLEELNRLRINECAFLFEDLDTGSFYNFSAEEIIKLQIAFSHKNERSQFEPFCETVLYFLETKF